MEVLDNFLKSGPLDEYRKLATFDWKKLRVALEGEEIIRYADLIVSKLKENPIFYPPCKAQNLHDIRELNYLRVKCFNQIEELDVMTIQKDIHKQVVYYETLLNYDFSFCAKNLLSKSMFAIFLFNLASADHHDILLKTIGGEYLGCFAMTEISHGSNTKAIRTRATYDPKTKQFVVHTPDFEAAKCWVGNLGQTATHVLLFAQLYTPDGKCHGVHQFVIQIRDENSLMPYPGVIVGDMGERVGLHGLDNGFMLFDHFHVDRSCLLNKWAKITEDGVYEQKASAKPFQASLRVMSLARISVIFHSNPSLIKGVTIALRYSAVRKQFGRDENDKEEIAILEYPLHQYRLIPYLACAIVFKKVFVDLYVEANQLSRHENVDKLKLGEELHALSCAAKATVTWTVQAGLQECREACGGHGYLKASAIGTLRENNDAILTYEGDNNVIVQQTSNWLLKLWSLVMENKVLDYPLNSVNFLNNSRKILNGRYNENGHVFKANEINDMYQWLIVYLLNAYYTKIKEHGDAKNELVAFYGQPLAKIYTHYFALKGFHVFVNQVQDRNVRNVLEKVHALYGLYNIEIFSKFLYQGGYLKSLKLQNIIMQLCANLKNDAIGLVDAIAPDDFLINSVLGHSDGDVYKRIQGSFYYENAFARPDCWKSIAAKL